MTAELSAGEQTVASGLGGVVDLVVAAYKAGAGGTFLAHRFACIGGNKMNDLDDPRRGESLAAVIRNKPSLYRFYEEVYSRN